jgi:hypothetical protein
MLVAVECHNASCQHLGYARSEILPGALVCSVCGVRSWFGKPVQKPPLSAYQVSKPQQREAA